MFSSKHSERAPEIYAADVQGEDKPCLLLSFHTEPKQETLDSDCDSGTQCSLVDSEMTSVKLEDCSQSLRLNVIIKDEEEIGNLNNRGKKKKTRNAYFSPVELEILMTAYGEYEPTLKKKGNTIAAARERELAWWKIADRFNACNPTGTKRTWQQLKMKYKNIVQTENRRKAEACRTGGAPPPLSEETALSHNSGRPIAEGFSGATSSHPTSPQDTKAYKRDTDGVLTLLNPSTVTDLQPADDNDEDEDTLSAVTERKRTERPIERNAGNDDEEECSSSTAPLASLPVKQLYKVYLQKQIQKCDLEMDHIRLQTQKTKMEIQLLEHQRCVR
ncbi:hypothetical protein UPYG_G00159860 [Umbra pygmaea]|uniref:Myb/SANT-like DNA-binding domain-containing protein n=1 Tax=Umbra pygmaea TaxID=75934 RepID=A0ABD0XLM8_UMBPY